MSSVPAPNYEMAYAVHTQACTYLLDEDGVCRWIVSQQGVVPAHVRQCIGAQFVACLDLQVEGGLVGELQVGARALFVRHTGDQMVLLRTGAIQHVDDRRVSQPEVAPPPAAIQSPRVQYGKAAGLPYRAKPPSFGVVRRHGEEQTITISNKVEAETVRQKARHMVPPDDWSR